MLGEPEKGDSMGTLGIVVIAVLAWGVVATLVVSICAIAGRADRGVRRAVPAAPRRRPARRRLPARHLHVS
jgi:hypothetical protein